MTDFQVSTLDAIHQEILADFSNRFPDADTSRYKHNWKWWRTAALATLPLHHHIETVYEDLLPDGAADAKLDRLGKIYGVARKGATVVKKADSLRLVGTAGATFTSGTQLVHRDGTLYQLDESGTIPVAGYLDVDVISIDTGTSTQKQRGQTLTFVSTPSGIQSIAELQLDLDEGGLDRETNGAYRVRILDKIAFPGMGGNRHDYEAWLLEIPGIDTAYCYPLRQGLGSVDVAALHGGSGTARLLSPTEITEAQAYVDERRPVSVADFRVLTVVAENVDIEILISPIEDGYAFDWDDTIPLAVSSFNAGTRVLKFTATRPGDILVKDRLVYKATGTRNDGSELVVEALGPAADEVTVAALTSAQAAAPPVAGNAVYSGGPLVAPVRAAILAHVDSLGPGKGVHGRGTWDDTLRLGMIYREALATLIVREVTIVSPGANVVPANIPPASTVGLVVPRQVIVRRG